MEWKRIVNTGLALLLAAAMVLPLVPAPAAAEDGIALQAAAGTNTSEATAIELKDGESFSLTAEYRQNYYYRVTTQKAHQFIRLTTDQTVSFGMPYSYGEHSYYSNGNVLSAITYSAGSYYIYLSQTFAESATITGRLDLYDNDINEPNNDVTKATVLTPGVPVNATLGCGGHDKDYFIVPTQPGKLIQLEITGLGSKEDADDTADVELRYCDPEDISSYNSTYLSYDRTITLHPGLLENYPFYLEADSYVAEPKTVTITATLVDNDGYEPNDVPDGAADLEWDTPTDIRLAGYDVDCFDLTTTKPGQEVTLTLSGIDQTALGNYYIGLQCNGATYALRKDGSVAFHSKEVGSYPVSLYISHSDGSKYTGRLTPVDFTVTATLVDGDDNELNDSKETATLLPLNTDGAFALGSPEDEDWFYFEVAGETQLYTLKLMDLNTDYSDKFSFELYAPDGTVLGSSSVKMYYTNAFSCTQQGIYYVRLYDRDAYSPASPLRIRVNEGGEDVYENNDTMAEAKELTPGQAVQFILSSADDVDWFRFHVPAADMTMKLSFVDRLYYYDLYDAYGNGLGEHTSYKFNKPGNYYIELSENQTGISTELRTMTLELLEADKDENNDYWKRATPIYEGVPYFCNISASNDLDWFTFTVPEGIKKLYIHGYGTLYSESDFNYIGDNAPSIASGSNITIAAPKADRYYYRCGSSGTITYHLLDADYTSIDTALELEPGVWGELPVAYYSNSYYQYISLGGLKAGDTVRLSVDDPERALYSTYTYFYLFRAEDQTSTVAGDYSNPFRGITVPSDGTYYLKANVYNNDPSVIKQWKLRYDLGTGSDPVTSIEGPDELTLTVGQSLYLDYRLTPATAVGNISSQKYLKYSIGSSSIASFSYGRLVGKALGETTLTLSTYDSPAITKTVAVHVVDPTVPPAPTALTITGAPETLEQGKKVTLTADVTPDNATVTWESNDSSILYVSANGTVTATGVGTATITAIAGDLTDSVEITVTAPQAQPTIDSITLDKYSLVFYMEEEGRQLTATVKPEAFDGQVTWYTSNNKVAAVDQTGMVTPVGTGVCIVYAQITDGKGDHSVSCSVTVQPKRVRVETIAFDKETLELPLTGSAMLALTITPDDATVKTVTYVSSDEGVVAVSRGGVLTPVSVGTATITATSVDGEKTAAITVTVIPGGLRGDIDLNGEVNALDAIQALRWTVGAITLTEEQQKLGDLNKDGYVDAADAIRILRYDAHLIDEI